MLRAAFVIESEHSAAARYRVLLNVEAFEREGVDVYPMVLPRAYRHRRRLFRDVEAFDVVVLQRRLIQPWEFLMLRRGARVLGYDFDDALIYRDSPRGYFFSLSRRVKFRAIVGGVDFITAGNANLAGLTGREEREVFIVPTPVDTAKYTPAGGRTAGGVRIGWIGSRTTIGYLDAVIPAIERVCRARPGTTLTVIADASPPGRPFIIHKQWREDREAAEVAAFDVGIMPLPDTPWTRGKCGFKLLLYGACGVPSVASPVGANVEIVEDGVTGLLAADAGAWEKALLSLVDDAGLRARLGGAARVKTEAERSARAVVPQWAQILRRMVAAKRTAGAGGAP